MSTEKKEVLQTMAKNFFFVRCSIDAARPDVHEKSHGRKDFDKVISNIKTILKMRGKNIFPIIGVQYVTNHNNYKDLPYAANFYRKLGVDYLTIKPQFKNVLNPNHDENLLDPNVVNPLMKQAQKYATDKYKVYAKYSQFEEALNFKTNDGRYYKKCYATPLSPYLDEDGNVEMCGNLKGRGFTMGNVYKQSFKKIWKSAHRKKCIKKIDLCKCPSGCKLDPLNKVLWDAFNPDKKKTHNDFV